MIKVPVYEIKESVLPAKRWNLTEGGKWRPVDDNDLLTGTNYEIAKEYPIKLELAAYNEVDYEANFSRDNWNKEETDLLWNLCEEFSLRFLIIQDRFNWEMRRRRGTNYEGKTVEEIKERFFEINGKLTGDKFIYDKEMDQKRRILLESYHARPLDQSTEEAFVVDYLAKLQQPGELERRLAERIETIKMLAGEQFTAGWPTLPELLKIAAGKGVARLTEKSKNSKKNKKKKKKPSESSHNHQLTASSSDAKSSVNKPANAPATVKKVKTSSGPAHAGNIYLMSTRMTPLRVGSARAVEKILSDFNLPFKPDLPTPAVVQKFDQVRAAIVKLIDVRKAAGLPASKSLETQEK